MRKEYDFSKGIKNPYAKLLKRLYSAEDLHDLLIINGNAERLIAEAGDVLEYQDKIRISDETSPKDQNTKAKKQNTGRNKKSTGQRKKKGL